MSIRRLPPLLVNQIAAGEVIERPASVVKELLENAIDAASSRIEVAIEDGGRTLIRVTDDGGGIAAADLPLAFAPHATSKIENVDDLFCVGTLGFRGEALASIGAVSQAKIISRTAGSDSAFSIECSADRLGEPTPCSGAPGTTIEVRNLFFNTPARRKFLKGDATEFGHILEQVLRVALAHPRVRFSLSHNAKRVYELPAVEDPRQRIRELMGADFSDQLVAVSADDHGVKISGWAAPPRDSRSSDKWQYVFVNGRFVRDRTLQAAIREAYRGLLEINRRPVVFLFYEVDPAEVDVNVHPAKIEVRFRNPQALYRLTLGVIRDGLLAADLSPELRLPPPDLGMGEFEPTRASTDNGPGDNGPGDNRPTDDRVEEERRQRVRQAMADFFKNLDPATARVGLHPRPRFDPPGMPDRPSAPPAWRPSYRPAGRSLADAGASRGFDESGFAARIDAPQTSVALLDAPTLSEPAEPRLFDEPVPHAPVETDDPLPAAPPTRRRRAIQLHDSFLVAETPDGLVVVDQHALHERILYERLKGKVADGRLTGQRLLIPETVRLTPRQTAVLGECRDLLARMGMEVEDFGNAAVAVQTFPLLLRRAKPGPFLAELLDSLADLDGRADPEMLLHKALDMAACKAAVKAGDKLTPDEVESLLAQADAVDQHHTCAHGRPTTLKLTLRDLERQFKRH